MKIIDWEYDDGSPLDPEATPPNYTELCEWVNKGLPRESRVSQWVIRYEELFRRVQRLIGLKSRYGKVETLKKPVHGDWSAGEAKKVVPMLRPSEPLESEDVSPEPGDIWIVKSFYHVDSKRLAMTDFLPVVVLSEKGNWVDIATIDIEPEHVERPSDTDLVCEPYEEMNWLSGGSPYLIELWSQHEIPKDFLVHYVGRIPEETAENLELVLSLLFGELEPDDAETAREILPIGLPIESEEDVRWQRRAWRERLMWPMILSREQAAREAILEEERQANGEDHDVVALAASEKPDKSEGPFPFGNFEYRGSDFKVCEDEEATVYLEGPLDSEVTHIWLGDISYELKHVEGELYEIVGAKLPDMEDFLDNHAQDPENYPIRFEEVRGS